MNDGSFRKECQKLLTVIQKYVEKSRPEFDICSIFFITVTLPETNFIYINNCNSFVIKKNSNFIMRSKKKQDA